MTQSSAQYDFGKFLREIRQARAMTQCVLAKIIWTDPAYLSKLERGVIPPPGAKTLEKLARTLAIPVSIMFERAGKCTYCKGSGKSERTKP